MVTDFFVRVRFVTITGILMTRLVKLEGSRGEKKTRYRGLENVFGVCGDFYSVGPGSGCAIFCAENFFLGFDV